MSYPFSSREDERGANTPQLPAEDSLPRTEAQGLTLRYTVPETWINQYQWGIGIFFVAFLAFLVFLKVGADPTKSGLLRGISDIFVLFGALVCVGVCIYSALLVQKLHKITPGILTGRAWVALFLLGGAAAVYAIGQAIWTVYDATLPVIPFPAAYDPFYLLVYPLSWIGIILLIPRGQSVAGRTRLLLDAFIVVASVTAIFWYFILGPTITTLGDSLEAKIVAMSYPLGDLSLCIAAAFLIFTPSGSAALGRALGSLAIGVTLLAVTDSLYAYGLLVVTYHTGLIQDIGWPLSWLFIGLSALYFPAGLQRLTGQQLEDDRPSNLSMTGAAIRATLPMLITLITCALLLVEVALTNQNLLLQVTLVCAGLFLLPVLRQVLTLVDNMLLNERLRVALGQSQRAFQQSQQALMNTSSRAELYEELRAGIGELQSVHARLARGDFKARAQVSGPLAPVAQSLNLLIERMNRWAQMAHMNQELEQEASQLNNALEQLSEGRIVTQLPSSLSGHATGSAFRSFLRLQQRLGIHFNRLRELSEYLINQQRANNDVVQKAEYAMQEQPLPEQKVQIALEAFALLQRRFSSQHSQLMELAEKSGLYNQPLPGQRSVSGLPSRASQEL